MSARHTFGPTISAAHALRLISSDKGQRLKLKENLKLPQPSKAAKELDRKLWAEKIRKAVYGGILASFIQGCNVSWRFVCHTVNLTFAFKGHSKAVKRKWLERLSR